MKIITQTSWGRNGVVILLLLAGFALRLIDLTDQPLDFHPARQLHAAIIARGMYSQMLIRGSSAPQEQQDANEAGYWSGKINPANAQSAIDMWREMTIYEPQILERLVALTYMIVGAEVLWIARVYSALFWVMGGLALFLLSRRAASTLGGCLALAFYLFLPFGVIASRSFQPDPLMVSLVLWAAYLAYRWSEENSWRWAVGTGILSGLAVLVKAPAACQVGFLLVFTVLTSWGLKRAIRQPQVWIVAAIAVLIPAAYYLLDKGARSSDYINFWLTSFSNMLLTPGFYIRWLNFLDGYVLDISLFFMAFAGTFLFALRARGIAFGFWLGYILSGLLLPALIVSHNYYSLPLIPAVAFSLSPLATPVVQVLTRQRKLLQIVFYAVIILALAYSAWNTRVLLVATNYQQEAAAWKNIGQQLPTDGPIIALSHDYNHRLRYYGWISTGAWPSASELNLTARRGSNLDDFPSMFTRLTEGYDYFLITLYGELNAQPQLSEMLYNNYPLLVDGPDYLLFDLKPDP